MRVFFSEAELRHAPSEYFRRGNLVPHPEQPDRAILLRDALGAAGHALVEAGDGGLSAILAVHDPDYVAFLRSAWTRWSESVDRDRPATPNCHPPRAHERLTSGIVGQLGYYSTDTSCPIGPGTWEAVYASAQAAAHAAGCVVGGVRIAYALCRPPGHHAYADASSGFCFLNNAAIAAQMLLQAHPRVAVIDIDAHHGNGTQEIFYRRCDVFFGSVHVDPSDFAPFYAGYPDELGTAGGHGCNLNVTLRSGDGDAEALGALDRLLRVVAAFQPGALVVSLGFDMSGDDPLSETTVTKAGFEAMAARIVGLGLPTVLVQEGGYLGPSLARNAVAFLSVCDAQLDER